MSEGQPPQERGEIQESAYLTARRRLLSSPWDNKRLTIREIRRAGWELAGNPTDLRIFGLNPLAWYVLGVRILGRTAVELTRDLHAEFVAVSVAQTLASRAPRITDVIDPFVGSGNLLFHLLRATGANRGVGLDSNEAALNLTKRNFSRLRSIGRLKAANVDIRLQDWSHAIACLQDRPTLVAVSPPWGPALDSRGLDLRKTAPPVIDILEQLSRQARAAPIFALIHTYPVMVAESVEAVRRDYVTLPTVKSDDPAISTHIDYLLVRLPPQA